MVLAALLCATLDGGAGILDATLNGGAGVLNAALDGGVGVVDAMLGGDAGIVDAVWLLALKGFGGGGAGLPAEDALLALVGHVREDVGADVGEDLARGELLNPYLARQMMESWVSGYACSSTGLRVNLGACRDHSLQGSLAQLSVAPPAPRGRCSPRSWSHVIDLVKEE